MIMKTRRYLWCAACLLLSGLLSSCSVFDRYDGGDDGTSAVVHLNFSVDKATQTRALSSANENTVNDLTVLIFDASGKIIGRKYSASLSAASSYTLDVPARESSGCTIYAFANLGSETYFAAKETRTEVDAMRTVAMTELT